MSLSNRTPPTEVDYAAYRERYRNWGRWGDEDELGTLNHITPATRRAASELVREGRTVSLSRPLDTKAGPANPYPAHHFVGTPGSGGIIDYVGMFIHGFVPTHIDALCHLPTTEGTTWRGVALDKSRLPVEHSGTIDFWRSGIVTRGVLYDVPRHRGTVSVVPGKPVHGWELADIAEASGIEPRPGDAVIIRSGREPFWESRPDEPTTSSVAGVHASCIEFLYETDAAMLVWDMQDAPTADQGIPNPGRSQATAVHVHHILLPYMGMPIVDNVDAEELATLCDELGRWEFQLVVAPLDIPGGTGSPVNPIAIL